MFRAEYRTRSLRQQGSLALDVQLVASPRRQSLN
jgi:hypothetical protein